jgi:tripeptide aminopeptidase
LKVLLRDFESAMLEVYAERLRAIAGDVEQEVAGCKIDVTISRQYRNLREGLQREPRAVGIAQQAHQRLGRQAKLTIIRGGTDGSMLTEMGLPTPNLSVGEHNPHSPLEWTCLEEMVQALEVGVEIVRLWGEEK